VALFSLQQLGESIDDERAAIEEDYVDKMVRVEYAGGDEEDVVYARLLAGLGAKAGFGVKARLAKLEGESFGGR